MNAIINLNHFCEVHGPQTIFTTQTIRDKSYIQSSSSIESSSLQNILNCESCSSIGNKMFFVSEDNSIMFVSSEKSLFGKEHQNALKQAALRSLCEISSNNQENLVFFGDSRINSLCYSFKIKDSYARGFEKLYSIVILMKDKMFLLNAQPFLAHNIKEIAKQIQESALKVYETEQKQFSQRAERLNTGKLSDLPSRSLKDLVGEQHIFAQLHSLFSWILWAGARYFTEVLTLGSPSMPSFCKDSPDGFAFISIDKEEFMMQNFPSGLGDNSIYDGEYNLRNLKQVSKLSFNQLLYCSLVGVQIVIRGKNNDFYKYFKELMPQAFHHLIAESPKYLTVQKCRILSLPSTDIFIPQNNVCRIDFMDELDVPTFIKYPIDLPSKLPTLMTKILYAVDEKLFTNHTMYKFIQAIVEEWKNKIICLSHHHHHHDDTAKLKKVLEIQSHDEELVKYWLSVL